MLSIYLQLIGFLGCLFLNIFTYMEKTPISKYLYTLLVLLTWQMYIIQFRD